MSPFRNALFAAAISGALVPAGVAQAPGASSRSVSSASANGRIVHQKRDEKQSAQELQNLQSRLDQAQAQIQQQQQEIDRTPKIFAGER